MITEILQSYCLDSIPHSFQVLQKLLNDFKFSPYKDILKLKQIHAQIHTHTQKNNKTSAVCDVITISIYLTKLILKIKESKILDSHIFLCTVSHCGKTLIFNYNTSVSLNPQFKGLNFTLCKVKKYIQFNFDLRVLLKEFGVKF